MDKTRHFDELASSSAMGIALTADEWGGIFSLLAAVALADGHFADSEKRRLRALSRTYRVDTLEQVERVVKHPPSQPTLSMMRRQGRVARFAIREAVAMALADGDYSKEERAVISRASEELGIPTNFMAAAAEWCLELIEVMERGKALVDND